MTMDRPLLQLRLRGFLCPISCEGDMEDDYDARLAASSLQSIPIQWIRPVWKSNHAAWKALSKDLLGTSLLMEETEYVEFPATLNVIDTLEGPALEIICNDVRQVDYAFVDRYKPTGKDEGDWIDIIRYTAGLEPLTKQVYLLKDVQRISGPIENAMTSLFMGGCVCDVQIYGLNENVPSITFNIAEQEDSMYAPVTANDVVQHVHALLAWERYRTSRKLQMR